MKPFNTCFLLIILFAWGSGIHCGGADLVTQSDGEEDEETDDGTNGSEDDTNASGAGSAQELEQMISGNTFYIESDNFQKRHGVKSLQYSGYGSGQIFFFFSQRGDEFVWAPGRSLAGGPRVWAQVDRMFVLSKRSEGTAHSARLLPHDIHFYFSCFARDVLSARHVRIRPVLCDVPSGAAWAPIWGDAVRWGWAGYDEPADGGTIATRDHFVE